MKKEARRILVFNVNWLGDVIFTTPIFKALKKHDPQSHVACLCVPRVREICECALYLDEVIVYDDKGRHRGLWGKVMLITELHRRKFDCVYILHRSWTRALLMFLAGIPRRVGYDTKGRGWLLTRRIALPEPGRHRSDDYLHVLEADGVPVEDRRCELRVDPGADGEIQKILKAEGVGDHDFPVVVHVGANWDLKRWPKEYFAELIRRLKRDLAVRAIIPGASRDRALAEAIADESGVHPVVLTGKTNLKQLMALMNRAKIVISADSGPMHIAHSVGAIVIALFGPTRPEITGPRGKGQGVVLQKDIVCNQDPCYNLTCPDNRCMSAITVGEVLAAAKTLMDNMAHNPPKETT